MKTTEDNTSVRDLDCFGDPLPNEEDKAIIDKYCSTDYEAPQVPAKRVLEDMGSECGIIASAARDYYYRYYADEVERAKMDAEDRIDNIIGNVILVMIAILVIASFICSFIL